MKCERPSIDEILDVMEDVLDDIEAHQSRYNIMMSNYDCNKITNYVAWHVWQKHKEKYPTAPLFFGHLHFLDESIRTASLFKIPNLPLIAENLQIFHRDNHKLAPYTFIKGVDLTFTFCCGDGGSN
ncbi:MAG: hypothetical protein NTV93_02990 [Verrucomicrobia bacterium]|nr:hypothetical protein [Verrucomicrobiota bacterium]